METTGSRQNTLELLYPADGALQMCLGYAVEGQFEVSCRYGLEGARHLMTVARPTWAGVRSEGRLVELESI